MSVPLPDLRGSLQPRDFGLKRFNLLNLISVGADQFPGFASQIYNFGFEFLAFGCKGHLMVGLGLQSTKLLFLICNLLFQSPDPLLSVREQPPQVFDLMLGFTWLSASSACSCTNHRLGSLS
jgi:hypothetical protein